MYRALVGPSNSSVVVMMYTLKDAHNWWHVLNDSPLWQDRIFHLLAALYGLMGVVALKVFHFLNFLVNAVRCLIFAFRRDIQHLKPEIVQHILIDVPSLAFFTTYALLVLFWAEIYYQVEFLLFIMCLLFLLGAEWIMHGLSQLMIGLWLVIWWKPVRVLVILSKMFFAGPATFIICFRNFVFLKVASPVFFARGVFICRLGISPIWWKTLLNVATVGYVTSICFACFLIRCVMMCLNAFNKAANLDLLEHPVLNFIYYLLVEILPSALVLFILRKLPPKRGINQYHNIR
ncbi:protein of unknown function DUF1084 [Cynara cardunculus var. scolymus]|uniref:THH1/TOM1/TOM3 domain-containing protein n=1 Tax=Cynara cardunculus var. scolymus TaxID=59895 RepID=A0A103XRK8_CYNCS|nr:protein of unknown function DUF1084 [Cynara cardunculus var. scolymus]